MACAVAFAVLLFPSIQTAWADELIFYLRNGDRLTGNLLAEDTNRVVLVTSWTNRLELPAAQIERREKKPEAGPGSKLQPGVASSTNAVVAPAPSPSVAPAILTDQQKQRLADSLAQYQADKITAGQYQEQRRRILGGAGEWASSAATVNTVSVPNPAAQNAAGTTAKATPGQAARTGGTVTPPPTPTPTAVTWRHRLHLDNWHGNLQVGANLGFSTVHSEAYNALFQANYAKGAFKNAVEYHMAYGKTDQTLSANRMDGRMKTEVDFKKGIRLYAYHLGAAGFDEVRQIDLDYEEGAGLGYHLWQRTNLVFNAEFGGSYQSYQYANHTTSDYASFRAGQEMTWKPYPKLSIIQKAQFIPNVADFNEFKFRGEATISYPFMTNLTLNLNFIDNYDSRPPAKVDHNDLQILSTVGYKF